MDNEIERKFLVKGEFKHLAKRSYRIRQGYLSVDPEKTVRIRIKDKQAFITIKGKTNETGLSRFEWEKELEFDEALKLLSLCGNQIIDKTRYIIPEGRGLIFEVDEFHGKHKGLIIVELELPYEDFKYEKPNWLGEEVSGKKEYYNSYLAAK